MEPKINIIDDDTGNVSDRSMADLISDYLHKDDK